MKDKKKEFEDIVSLYLESNPVLSSSHMSNELEIRFGTNYKIGQPVTKIEYDNVVQRLYHEGFKTNNSSGNQMLRIQNEYINNKTGRKMLSSIRTEIYGLNNIKKYCQTNSINDIEDFKLYNKEKVKDGDGNIVKPIDYPDLNFRVSLQSEKDIFKTSNFGKNILNNWGNNKKIFRHMNRISYVNDNFPLRIDMSIVKESHKKKFLIPEYTIQEAKVFESNVKYEIEIEFNNRVFNNLYSSFDLNIMTKKLHNNIKKISRIILSGLQDSYYPIPFSTRDNILNSYMNIIHDEEYIKNPKNQNKYTKQLFISSRHFIGPSSYTLQMENIVENPDLKESSIPNIRNNYTVTEKADGQRKLLYIHGNGLIYLIDMNIH